MYCSVCGFMLDERDNFCPNCGYPVQHNETKQNHTIYVEHTVHMAKEKPEEEHISVKGWVAIVAAILLPLVGLILGIVGTCKNRPASTKAPCVVAIPLSVFFWIIWTAVLMNL